MLLMRRLIFPSHFESLGLIQAIGMGCMRALGYDTHFLLLGVNSPSYSLQRNYGVAQFDQLISHNS